MTSSTTEGAGQSRPRLSVVVASSNHAALLAMCVDALVTQAPPDEVEIIVVRDAGRSNEIHQSGLRDRFPGVSWMDAPEASTVPRLRGLGLARARGGLVALLEDDCVVEPGWCVAALSGTGQAAAVGGAVEPGPYRRAMDWAVYFCEYGRFMLPVPAGSNTPLPGNNVVYSQRALAGLPEAERMEFREVFVHAAWHGSGVVTKADGSLVVRNMNSWSLRHVTSVPFQHGRAYAAQRFAVRSPAVRAGVALLALALPVVKVLRIAKETLSRRRLALQLVIALPWILVFVGSWSAGEMLGCVAGPGDSRSHWR